MPEPVAGLLLDSGDTLLRPVTGAWWPGPRFAEIVGDRCPGLALDDDAVLEPALDAAMAHLDARLDEQVPDEEAEVRLFEGYYDVLLRELGCAPVDPALRRELAVALVEGAIVEPFPDTADMLARWKERGLRVALVSNSWPSLESHLARLGLREHLDEVVISARLGVWKPDEAIYRYAAAALDLPPGRLLVVDDAPDYVAHARKLGFRALVIDRTGAGGDVHDLAGVDRALTEDAS